MKTKAQLVERWGGVLESTKEHLPVYLEKYNTPEENLQGHHTGNLNSEYARLARVDYLLNNDVDGFKNNLRIATNYAIELFEIFEQINKTNPSLFSTFHWMSPLLPGHFSMFKFCLLLDALASGDLMIATKLANYMGGRSEIENQEDDEFILSIGYSLKYSVENNKEQLKQWLPRLKVVCESPEYTVSDFLGYYLVLQALLERNLEQANEAFKQLIIFHKKRCKKTLKDYPFRSYFYNSPDADLFVWGVGLANLCRHYGLNVIVDDPLIPTELIIPIENSI